MKTSGVFHRAWIVLALIATASACTTTRVAEPTAGSGPVLRSSLREGRVRSIRMQLGHAQDRIRQLEAELADQPAAIREKTREIQALETREQQLTEQLELSRETSEELRRELAAARAAAEAAAAGAAVDPSPEIARLEVELESERKRRMEAEDQLARLREETSAGPYEAAPQAALAEAQAEIDRLREQLSRERQERDDLERRFAELNVQLEQRPAVAPAAAANPEMAELEEDQRRLMAAIKQDLEASRRRETELRETIASMQGEGGEQLADEVRNLEAENRALQASLDAEHERNVELAAKLEVATRVADLIFKMRREGRLPSPEALEEAAGQ